MSSIQNQNIAFLYALSTVLLWSTVATAFKLSLSLLTPLQLVSLAATTSTVALVIGTWFNGSLKQVPHIIRQKPLLYLTLGALNPTAYYLALFAGYDLLPAQVAAPVNYSWAVLLPLLAAPILKQPLTRWQLLGCLLGYLGVVIIATRGEFTNFNNLSVAGIGLVLLSAVFWCLYWITNTKNTEEPTVSLLCCTLCSLPMLCIINLFGPDWPALTLPALGGAIYVGLFEMGVTSMLWLKALKAATKTAQITSLMFLSPVLSLLLISTVLGETIHLSVIPGVTLIIAGMAIQQWMVHKQGG